MTDLREIVTRKRDGGTLSADDMAAIVLGYARGEVSDALVAAFLMAVFTRGLDRGETHTLTRAMVDSGINLSLDGISRPKVDKHSTGGVADGVTLVFAPLVASLGMAAAKLSGRGLGHTGGTLDKLESIPGLRTDLTPEELTRQVESVGCAVAAQSNDLVPADGKLYALRDETATIESLPMIAASVMSKKLAVGSDLILLDVKAGSGAFMKTPEAATELAETCLAIAKEWGRACSAAVTDMSQPLGDAIGNALDVVEAIDVLRGERSGRLRELTIEIAVQAQRSLIGVSEEEARSRAERALASGDALERFRLMVEAQGGDPRVVDDPGSVLPSAPERLPIELEVAGVIVAIDAEAIGRAARDLGAGRARKEDPIDPAVGIVLHAKIGDTLDAGEPIGEVHARDRDWAEVAARRVVEAISLTDSGVEPPPLVYGWHGD
ncbi:MAG: thymidine phosphorylase [Actinomycetota bacterium]